jgi:hypothetical protein
MGDKKKAPTTIYRYRAFNELTVSALCSDQLFFARADAFNDPLDCEPCFVADSDLQSLKEALKHLLHHRVSTQVNESLKRARIKGPKAVAHADKIASHEVSKRLADIAYHATNPDYTGTTEENEIRLITQEIESELRQHYARGVCCFSSANLDPLLWSHYGDSHKGLCIGYSLDRDPRPDLQKVVYGGRRSIKTSTVVKAILHHDAKAKKLLEREILLRKADCWKYENEWRLIGSHGIQDSPLKLKNVTFGLRCPKAVKHAIVKSLTGRVDKIEFFEVSSVRGRFSLKKESLNLDELPNYMPRTAQSAHEIFSVIDSDVG